MDHKSGFKKSDVPKDQEKPDESNLVKDQKVLRESGVLKDQDKITLQKELDQNSTALQKHTDELRRVMGRGNEQKDSTESIEAPDATARRVAAAEAIEEYKQRHELWSSPEKAYQAITLIGGYALNRLHEKYGDDIVKSVSETKNEAVEWGKEKIEAAKEIGNRLVHDESSTRFGDSSQNIDKPQNMNVSKPDEDLDKQ